MITAMEKQTVYFTMVKHPLKNWIRIGNAYKSRKTASGWIPFVRGAWRGLRVKISQCTLTFIDGKLSDRSRRMLNEKYKIDS
jgi:hypothetical protein